MTTTLTTPTRTATATLVLDVAWSRRTTSVAHELIGQPYPDVTVRAPRARSGRLTLLAADTATADALEGVLTDLAAVTVTSTDVPALDGMRLVVVDGSVDRTLDPRTQRAWIIDADFREVTP